MKLLLSIVYLIWVVPVSAQSNNNFDSVFGDWVVERVGPADLVASVWIDNSTKGFGYRCYKF